MITRHIIKLFITCKLMLLLHSLNRKPALFFGSEQEGAACSPGRATEERLLTSVCLMASRCLWRAWVRSSSWPSSASSRSLALHMSLMCRCSTAFCSSNSTLAFRSRRSSASRAGTREGGEQVGGTRVRMSRLKKVTYYTSRCEWD